MMVKKLLKNVLKVKVPVYQIEPGETKEIELVKPDDIHYRGIQLGHLVEVKAPKEEISPPKKLKIKTKKKK